MRYKQHYEGEWFTPRRKRWFMRCCGCGLTHIINFRLIGNNRIQMQAFLKEKEMKDKPFDKREDKDAKKSFKRSNKSVKPVAKDKNSTRRKMSTPMKKSK